MMSLKKLDPVLYFNNNTLEKQIEALKKKSQTEEIEKQIKLIESGIYGEQKVLYELMNSHIGMYILHDLNLKFKNLEAQIDFLVMTKKSVFVIECKNMYGNITIDRNGSFIREIDFMGKKNKTGIYNPLTQCERHIELLKAITFEKYSILKKLLFGNKIDDLFIPIVVLANDKTILNDYYAPNEIKKKVIRADFLIQYIKKVDSGKESKYSEKYMKNYCETILNEYQVETKPIELLDLEKNLKNDLELKEKLRKYRLEKSREESVKPFIVFNDKTLEDLIKKKPKTKEELFPIEGLGEYKIEKYGEDLLKIMNY